MIGGLSDRDLALAQGDLTLYTLSALGFLLGALLACLAIHHLRRHVAPRIDQIIDRALLYREKSRR